MTQTLDISAFAEKFSWVIILAVAVLILILVYYLVRTGRRRRPTNLDPGKESIWKKQFEKSKLRRRIDELLYPRGLTSAQPVFSQAPYSSSESPPPTAALPATRARLDAAVPEQVSLDRVFDVAASVRWPESPDLEEAGLTQLESRPVRLFWPASEDYVRLRLQIKAPECQIVGNDHYTFLLPKDEDSPVFYFNLIPQQIGDITIILTLYQENDTLGNTRVLTAAVAQVAGEVHLAVTSRSVPVDFTPSAIDKAHTPPGLTPALSDRLRRAFTASPHFDNDATLRTLFIDTRITPWRDLIPDNTANRTARVTALVHTLYDRANAAGENALILFLHVLAENTNSGDVLHHDLLTLAADLAYGGA